MSEKRNEDLEALLVKRTEIIKSLESYHTLEVYPEFFNEIIECKTVKDYVSVISKKYESIFLEFVNKEWSVRDLATHSLSFVQSLDRHVVFQHTSFDIKEAEVPYCVAGFVKKNEETSRLYVTKEGYRILNGLRLVRGEYPLNLTRNAP